MRLLASIDLTDISVLFVFCILSRVFNCPCLLFLLSLVNMCEICGGPHFTVKCPQYEGSSEQYYTNPFAHSQPYYSQGYHPSHYYGSYRQQQYDQFSGSNFSGGMVDKLSRIESLLTQLVGKDANTQKTLSLTLSEHDILLKNQQTMLLDFQRSEEYMVRRLDERFLEEVEVQVQPEQPPTAGYTYDVDGNYLGYMNLLGELFPTFPEPGKEPYMEYEDESDEEFIPEPETIMAISVPPPVPHEKGEENTGKLIIDFSCSDEEIDAQLAAYERLKGEGRDEKDEEITLETETKMDVEVPPPVLQDITYDVWGDTDDDVYDGEWVDYQEFPEEEVDLGESIEFMFGFEIEEMEELEERLSWEDEFREELIGLPDYEDIGDFDPEGDLEVLGTLLEGKPIEVIDPTPHEETKCGDHRVEALDLKVVEEEEHHSRPVVLMVNATKGSKPREGATKERTQGDRDHVRLGGRRRVKELMDHNCPSHYMSRIRHGPGKFKDRWSDPFVNFKIFSNSTIKFLFFYNKKTGWN